MQDTENKNISDSAVQESDMAPDKTDVDAAGKQPEDKPACGEENETAATAEAQETQETQDAQETQTEEGAPDAAENKLNKWLPAPLGYGIFFGVLAVAIGLGLLICLL
ncbi:MAG TPA: hypothetical protein H9690_00365 [Firmicutes bacterium]|nr:hypothetical protein [Bacillota bacterium]